LPALPAGAVTAVSQVLASGSLAGGSKPVLAEPGPEPWSFPFGMPLPGSGSC